jgi:hypothetical protein
MAAPHLQIPVVVINGICGNADSHFAILAVNISGEASPTGALEIHHGDWR